MSAINTAYAGFGEVTKQQKAAIAATVEALRAEVRQPTVAQITVVVMGAARREGVMIDQVIDAPGGQMLNLFGPDGKVFMQVPLS